MVRLSLRRLQPGAVFASFFGLLDIKLGCEIVLLFGLINKVAGVYGLIMVFVGGSFVQFLFYAYSIATLFAFLWALNVVKRETAHKTLLVAHLYLLDHVILQIFHYIFFYTYWYINPHDGKRELNSQAQKDIVQLAVHRGDIEPIGDGDAHSTDAVRAALGIWNKEKGFALGIIGFGFALKVYFILLLYSYAAHLRLQTYNTLPLTAHAQSLVSRHVSAPPMAGNGSARVLHAEDDHELELANAEAEVARYTGEAKSAKPAKANPSTAPASASAGAAAPGSAAPGAEAKGKKKDDDDSDFDSWE